MHKVGELSPGVNIVPGGALGALEGAGGAACGPAASGRVSALPCQKSNISDKTPSPIAEFEARFGPANPADNRTKQGRVRLSMMGHEVALGGLNSSEKKQSFALVENVKCLVARHGIERVGFLTLTFPPDVREPQEASRRFNNANRRLLGELFPERVVVIEPHKDARPHFHCLVATSGDIRTGFDWETFREACDIGRERGWNSPQCRARTRAYAGAASPALRDLWGILRGRLPGYGFGRSELLPVRSSMEAVAQYVGKYLEKGMPHRLDHWEGVRLVRYSQANDWRAVKAGFAWLSSGQQWRAFVGEVAEILHAETLEDLRDRLGKRWAYKLLALRQTHPEVTASEAARVLLDVRMRQPLTSSSVASRQTLAEG